MHAHVRRDHVLPGDDTPLERLIIGPTGVLVARTPAGRVDRPRQAARLRRDVRAVRTVLDAAGLRALPATAVLCRSAAEAAALTEDALADERYGPSTVRAALLALDPPPFVADVRPQAPAAPRTARPAASPVQR